MAGGRLQHKIESSDSFHGRFIGLSNSMVEQYNGPPHSAHKSSPSPHLLSQTNVLGYGTLKYASSRQTAMYYH